jgi:cytochrome b subunit of formate dehydrogenase
VLPGTARSASRCSCASQYGCLRRVGLVCILLATLYITGVDTIIAGTHRNLIFGGHKLATIALCVLVAGHPYMALVNRAIRHALRGMLTGEVDREWAYKHYPALGALQRRTRARLQFDTPP